MIRFLLTAALLSPVPAIAKTWVDMECSQVLISAEGGPFYFQAAEKQVVSCQVADWPINTPIASMACADGATPKMELKTDHTLYWDGVEMNAYDGPLPCGANGAEWPD